MSFKLLKPPRFCRLVKGSTVLLELPEGLRGYEAQLVTDIEECGASTVVVRLEPSYGSCETLACDSDVDIVVHVGHVPYAIRPIYSCRGTRVIYIPVVVELDDKAEKMLGKLVDYVMSLGWYRVGIAYVYSYSSHAAHMANMLRRYGITAEASHILGCYFGGLESQNVDGYVVIGSRFHALGLGLAVHAEKEILLYEPDTGSYTQYTREIVRELQKRYWVASQASDARSWGIILGGRGSQCRPILSTMLVGLLRSMDRSVRVYRSDRLCRHDLDQLKNVDAFVVTSCPRIAVEDLGDYPRPVLVPGELPYALGLAERLRFPW